MSLGEFWVLGDIERMCQEKKKNEYKEILAEVHADLNRERYEKRKLRLMAVAADVRAYPREECPEEDFKTILLRNGIEPSSLTEWELSEINNSL